jgi:hypothetical protein
MNKNAIVVDLTNVSTADAYAWGVEAGAFMQYDNHMLVGQHAIFAGNIGMIEQICIERGVDLDVFSSDGKLLTILISKRKRK